MPERLKWSSPLGPDIRRHSRDLSSVGAANRLTECDSYALCTVLSRNEQVFEKFKRVIGFDLPRKPACASKGAIAAICIGPGQWLVRHDGGIDQIVENHLAATFGDSASASNQTSGHAVPLRHDGANDRIFEKQLTAALGSSASVFNQTSGRSVFRLSGPNARDILAKGVLLDLHPEAFGPESACSTSVAHMAVTFWQIDDIPTYEFSVFTSFAESLWEWIVNSGREFGLDTEFSSQIDR